MLDAHAAVLDAPATLDEVRALHDDYVECLDDLRLDDWPLFFTEACLYRVIPRENHEAGYALCTMQAESRGMLVDRVAGLLRTQVFAPRTYRRFTTNARLKGHGPEGTRVRSNVLMVQTLLDKQSDVVLSGTALDLLRRDPATGRLLFAERVVVMDGEMVPNSLVYPA